MRNNYLRLPQRRTKKLRINNFFGGLNTDVDESVLAPGLAAENYNFDFSSGALTDGFGLDAFPALAGANIASMWLYTRLDKSTGARQEILMYASPAGEIYYLPPSGPSVSPQKLEGLELKGRVKGVNYRLYEEDVVLICSDNDNMAVWNGLNSAYTVPSSPFIRSMVMHYERMFVVDSDGETLRFSGDLDPTNWNNSLTDGGYITLADDRGRLTKLVSFLNYVYIFRDYGINRLTAFADQTEFAVTGLFVSSGRIYPETVALCGDRVVFLADDGLYSFDGLSTRRILTCLAGLIEPTQNACAAYSGGRYYLACKLKGLSVTGCETGAFINNGLLSYEPLSGKYCITRGVDVNSFTVLSDRLLAVSGTTATDGTAAEIIRSSRNFSQPLKKKWRSPFTDLGSDSIKTLREIIIDSSGPVKLSVRADDIEKTFTVDGGTKPSRVKVNLRGVKLSFSIETESEGVTVSRPTLVLSE